MVFDVRNIEVMDSFECVGNVVFSKETIEKKKQKATLLSAGEARSLMFQQRYFMILQQLFRDSKFVDLARGKRGADFPVISFHGVEKNESPSPGVNTQSLLLIHETDAGEEPKWRFEVTPVESLPGSIGVKVVFGMLSKGDEGKLFIEDIHQAVPVKLDSVQSTNDFITDNTYVLIKGEMVDGTFIASEMTLPPIPKRSLCESSANLFGGPLELTAEIVASVVGHPPEDTSVAILSNVFLESPATLERLDTLFSGFEECDAVPSMFILTGNFTSRPFNPLNGDSLRSFQKAFESFSQLLAKHPITLERTKIVLVPGHQDPGCGILPQPPFTDTLVRGISSRFPNVILASNPCRVRVHDRYVIIHTGNTVERLRKSRLVAATSGNSEDDEGLKLSRFLISQMHLSPGPVRNVPVAWDFDSGLKLYPPPHALFLVDSSTAPFSKDLHTETLVVGMPTFSLSQASTSEFQLYSPYSNESTLSSL